MIRFNSATFAGGVPRHGRAVLGFARLLLILAAASAWAQSVEELRLTVGKSIVLDYPADVRQISTSDPAVVDAVAVSTREVLLNAKAAGSATVVVWSRAGDRTIYSVNVEQNLESLRRLLKDTFPNENIQLQATRDSLALTGQASSKEIADRALALVTPFGKSIVNNLRIAATPVDKQVLLKVRFAELNRTAIQSFGVNLLSTGATGTIGRVTTGQFSPPVPGGVSSAGTEGAFGITDALNIFAFRPDLNLGGRHSTDSGRAESGDDERQGSELPGRWRIPDSGAPGRRQCRRRNHPIP
jgi:pilus assembly protein CpaC